MTPERQRIVIAEAHLGISIITDSGLTDEDGRWYWAEWEKPTEQRVYPKDYTGDLNAMSEAVAYFTEIYGFAFQEKYLRELRRVVTRRRRDCNDTQIAYWIAEATPPQRAEAVLRALEKWEEITP